MEMGNIGFWNILLDMAALTLCAITVLYIIGKKRPLTSQTVQHASDERIQTIVEKTFDQFIRLQPGRSFNGLIETVAVEKPRSQPLVVDTIPAVDGVKKPAVPRRKSKKARPKVLDAAASSKTGRRDAKSMRVYQATASGMSVKKISEKLGVPRCEVELMAKFQQREHSGAAVL